MLELSSSSYILTSKISVFLSVTHQRYLQDVYQAPAGICSNCFGPTYGQRRTARFVTNDYNYTSSVTAMKRVLKWKSRLQHRHQAKVALMYHIVNSLVDTPPEQHRHPQVGLPRLRNLVNIHMSSSNGN